MVVTYGSSGAKHRMTPRQGLYSSPQAPISATTLHIVCAATIGQDAETRLLESSRQQTRPRREVLREYNFQKLHSVTIPVQL